MSANLDQTKDEILSKIDVQAELESMGIQFAGNLASTGWHPAHDPYREDKHPSCSVFLGHGSHRGTIMRRGPTKDTAVSFWDLARDFNSQLAGSDFGDILRHFAEQAGVEIKGSSKDKTKELIHVYDYTDEKGEVVHQTCRYNPKEFLQRRPDGQGGHIWNLSDIEVVPYNLPNVISADRIFITEGEKAADAVNSLGDLVATCGPMGAKKWWSSLLPHYRDKDIVILQDNDITGEAHTQILMKNLFEHVKSIRIVKLPGLPDKGDAHDWIVDQKHTKDEFLKQVSDTPVETEFIDPILKLNEIHAVIMVGGKCQVLNEVIDPVFDRPDVNFSGIYDFRNRYWNRKVPNVKTGPNQPKEIGLADAWLEDPDRRQYEGIVFDPEEKSPEEYYNLFRGFTISAEPGDWGLFYDHICEIICSGNDDHSMWLLTWLARIVQEPGGKRPGTSIVLRGEQGTGKGCFVSLFGRIFGSHYLHVQNQIHLTSRFNQHLKDAILVFVDEGFWAGDKAAEGTLKGMVTEDTFIIEPKNINAYPVKNHVNLIMASNSEWVVPAAMEERRFAVFDVSAAKRQNKPYFKKIFRQMINDGGCEAMLYDLQQFNLASHRKQYDISVIPRTAALMDQIVHSMGIAQKFWFERLRDGILLPSHDSWKTEIQSVTFHASYIVFADSLGAQRNKKESFQFAKELRRMCPAMIRRRMSKVDETGSRPWIYKFPSLEECRELFCRKLKININFDNDDEIEEDELEV